MADRSLQCGSVFLLSPFNATLVNGEVWLLNVEAVVSFS